MYGRRTPLSVSGVTAPRGFGTMRMSPAGARLRTCRDDTGRTSAYCRTPSRRSTKYEHHQTWINSRPLDRRWTEHTGAMVLLSNAHSCSGLSRYTCDRPGGLVSSRGRLRPATSLARRYPCACHPLVIVGFLAERRHPHHGSPNFNETGIGCGSLVFYVVRSGSPPVGELCVRHTRHRCVAWKLISPTPSLNVTPSYRSTGTEKSRLSA